MGLRIVTWCLGRIPTLIVWAGLVALFIYGATHNWRFFQAEEKPKEAKEETEPAKEEPFSSYIQDRPFDVPVRVTHDPKTCPVGKKPVEFKSPESAALAGIATMKLEPRSVALTIEAHGEVMQDPYATAKVSPRVGGVFVSIEKQLGDPVRTGELLALIESADVGKAKAAYVTAKAALESREAERALLEAGKSPPGSVVKAESAVREARAALFAARQAITNLGLPLPTTAEERLPDEAFAQALEQLGIPADKRRALEVSLRIQGKPLPTNLLPLFSPLDGAVVNRVGVVGETVAALQLIFEVGDPTRVQVFLDVRQEDMGQIALGQCLTFRVEGGAQLPAVSGKLDWISPTVDEKTRTVRVRARVSNPGGRLKRGAFGAGTVTVAPNRLALVAPRDAIQWEGCSYIVFVKKTEDGKTAYWPRKVTLGVRDDSGVEITSGLAAGDEIVSAGSHVLKSELLKARIGEAEE